MGQHQEDSAVNIGIGSIRSTAVKAALGAILALGLLAGPAFATTLSVTPSIQGSGRVADAAAPYSCTFAAVHNTDVNSTPCATSPGYAGSRLSCTISRICLIIPITQLNLTATPATGWEFAGWSGTGCSGTNPVCAMSVFALASDPPSQSFAPRATFREIVNTDVTSPTVSNGGITNHPDVTLNYSSFLGTSFICSLDGTSKSCAIQPDHSGSSTFTGLPDGAHTFTISAKNAAGNIGDPRTYIWTVDTVAPTASFDTSTGPGEGALQTISSETFTFGSSEPTGATFQCSLDGAAFAACTSPQA
jgi:hypothetical protein